LDSLILKKAASYCNYQERTHAEVRKRLADWKVYGLEAEEIISYLIVENYLNEERFAKAYAGGKFRVKKWGKNRIIFELKARKISDYCIKQALNEIDDDDYFETVKNLLDLKRNQLSKELSELELKQKLYNYLISKGFESEIVGKELKKNFNLR
jgi:regulatory protein